MTEPFDEAIEILTDVVYQSCGKRDCPHSEWYLDSMALSAYADAIRFLARQGKVEITSDHGRPNKGGCENTMQQTRGGKK